MIKKWNYKISRKKSITSSTQQNRNSNIDNALKVLKAHRKYGKNSLSSNDIDEIKGIETLDIQTILISRRKNET